LNSHNIDEEMKDWKFSLHVCCLERYYASKTHIVTEESISEHHG